MLLESWALRINALIGYVITHILSADPPQEESLRYRIELLNLLL